MGKLSAGSLNRRITISERVSSVDSFGQPTVAWKRVCDVFANIKTITGSGFVNQEFITANIELSRAAVSFRIRFRRGIHAGMRVEHDGQLYDIRVVLPDEDGREFMDLGCAIGSNDGE